MFKAIRSFGSLVLVLVLLAAGTVPAVAADDPDMQPTQILATAYTGISSTVTVFVANNQDVDVASFNVLLEVDDGGGYQTVDNITGNFIYGNQNAWYAETQVQFDWTPAAAGGYTLRATVDTPDSVVETDETNNQIAQAVTVVDLTDITVMVRLEGSDAVVWSGEVTFSTSTITDKEGTTHTVDHPTVLGALEEAATSGGFDYVVSSAWGDLAYVEEVADEAAAGMDGWKYRVDWADAGVAAVGYTLSDGDVVLWYYATWGGSQPMRLTLNSTSLASTENLTATVEYYDDTSWSALSGATLYVGSLAYTTDGSGQVTDISLSPGSYTVYAAKGDYTQYVRTAQQTVVVHVTLALQQGWNFISVPKKLTSDNCTAATVFLGVDTDGHSIFQYRPATGWSAMGSSDNVSPLEGIWIYSSGVQTLRPEFSTDRLQVPPSQTLAAGWNAIGFSDFDAATANAALTSVESKWATLIGFNAANQVYEISIINGAPSGDDHSESRNMECWKGYWLYMTEAGELAGISS